MKNALSKEKIAAQSHMVQAKENLIRLQIMDYSLLAIRDYKTENLILGSVYGLSSYFKAVKTPRLYTLVSCNKRIPLETGISNSVRIFQNFESLKWSELYFHFFKNLTDIDTRDFISKNILFSLDTHLAIYRSLAENAAPLGEEPILSNPIDRNRSQVLFTSLLMDQGHVELLSVFYIYELFLTAINQDYPIGCNKFITPAEAQHLLSYLISRQTVDLVQGKIKINFANLVFTLKDYINHQGRILLPQICEQEELSLNIFQMKTEFHKYKNNFGSNFFEAPFTLETM